MFWALMWGAVLLTFVVYLPALHNQFVNFDDPVYVLKNPLIRHLNFSSFLLMLKDFSQSTFWIPLTWLSLSVDYHFGRLIPDFYHMHNLLLHCANTALVYLLSFRIIGLADKNALRGEEKPSARIMAASFFAALLFGLHPLHVESVAWVTERKDVLYGLFFLSSVLMYLSHSERPRVWKYWLSFLFFLFAVAAKPMAITLPLVLILLDVWPLGKSKAGWPRALLNKIPFLAVSAVSVLTTLVFYYANKNLVFDTFKSFRFMNAAHSLIFYLVKTAIPSGLRVFYPADLHKTFSLEYILAALLVVGIFVLAVVHRKKSPGVAAAWFYYFLTLAPVLGFVQSGVQSSADRFTYLPSLGPLILFAVVFVDLFYKRRFFLVLLAAGIISGLALSTHKQIATWKDSVTLWVNVLTIQPGNSSYAYAAMAEAHKDAGRLDDAKSEIEMAMKINPDSPGYYAMRGEIYLKQSLVDDAIGDLRRSISLVRAASSALAGYHPHWLLARAYVQKGMYPEALEEAREAVRIKMDGPEAYHVLGLAYAGLKWYPEAIEAYRKALSLVPDDTNAEYLRDLTAACVNSVINKSRVRKKTKRSAR